MQNLFDAIKGKIFGIVKEWLPEIIVMAITWLINQSSQEERQAIGEKGGRWVTDNCKKLLGDDWEKLESALQVAQHDLNIGFHAGLDYDDKLGGA